MLYGHLSDYELAALFHDVATERCASWEEADAREAELDRLRAAMDARGVRLEDWALTAHQDRTAGRCPSRG